MKHHQHTPSSEAKTTPNDVVRWARELQQLYARMTPFFARPEPRHRCLLYLQAFSVTWHAKMAGNWLIRQAKHCPIAFKGCSPLRARRKTWFVMQIAPT